MKSTAAAVAFAIAALAAGGFAWQTRQSHEETKAALAGATSQLDKSKADLKVAQEEATGLRKLATEQKMAAEQAQADLNAARQFMEAERLTVARLREDLAKAMMRVTPGARPTAAQALPPGMVVPMLAPPQPMQVRIAPGGGATAVGAPAPAR